MASARESRFNRSSDLSKKFTPSISSNHGSATSWNSVRWMKPAPGFKSTTKSNPFMEKDQQASRTSSYSSASVESSRKSRLDDYYTRKRDTPSYTPSYSAQTNRYKFPSETRAADQKSASYALVKRFADTNNRRDSLSSELKDRHSSITSANRYDGGLTRRTNPESGRSSRRDSLNSAYRTNYNEPDNNLVLKAAVSALKATADSLSAGVTSRFASEPLRSTPSRALSTSYNPSASYYSRRESNTSLLHPGSYIDNNRELSSSRSWPPSPARQASLGPTLSSGLGSHLGSGSLGQTYSRYSVGPESFASRRGSYYDTSGGASRRGSTTGAQNPGANSFNLSYRKWLLNNSFNNAMTTSYTEKSPTSQNSLQVPSYSSYRSVSDSLIASQYSTPYTSQYSSAKPAPSMSNAQRILQKNRFTYKKPESDGYDSSSSETIVQESESRPSKPRRKRSTTGSLRRSGKRKKDRSRQECSSSDEEPTLKGSFTYRMNLRRKRLMKSKAVLEASIPQFSSPDVLLDISPSILARRDLDYPDVDQCDSRTATPVACEDPKGTFVHAPTASTKLFNEVASRNLSLEEAPAATHLPADITASHCAETPILQDAVPESKIGPPCEDSKPVQGSFADCESVTRHPSVSALDAETGSADANFKDTETELVQSFSQQQSLADTAGLIDVATEKICLNDETELQSSEVNDPVKIGQQSQTPPPMEIDFRALDEAAQLCLESRNGRNVQSPEKQLADRVSPLNIEEVYVSERVISIQKQKNVSTAASVPLTCSAKKSTTEKDHKEAAVEENSLPTRKPVEGCLPVAKDPIVRKLVVLHTSPTATTISRISQGKEESACEQEKLPSHRTSNGIVDSHKQLLPLPKTDDVSGAVKPVLKDSGIVADIDPEERDAVTPTADLQLTAHRLPSIDKEVSDLLNLSEELRSSSHSLQAERGVSSSVSGSDSRFQTPEVTRTPQPQQAVILSNIDELPLVDDLISQRDITPTLQRKASQESVGSFFSANSDDNTATMEVLPLPTITHNAFNARPKPFTSSFESINLQRSYHQVERATKHPPLEASLRKQAFAGSLPALQRIVSNSSTGSHGAMLVSGRASSLEKAASKIDEMLRIARKRHESIKTATRQSVEHLDQVSEGFRRESEKLQMERSAHSALPPVPRSQRMQQPYFATQQPLPQIKSDLDRSMLQQERSAFQPIQVNAPVLLDNDPIQQIPPNDTKRDFTQRWLDDDLHSLTQGPSVKPDLLQFGPGDMDARSIGSGSAEIEAIIGRDKGHTPRSHVPDIVPKRHKKQHKAVIKPSPLQYASSFQSIPTIPDTIPETNGNYVRALPEVPVRKDSLSSIDSARQTVGRALLNKLAGVPPSHPTVELFSDPTADRGHVARKVKGYVSNTSDSDTDHIPRNNRGKPSGRPPLSHHMAKFTQRFESPDLELHQQKHYSDEEAWPVTPRRLEKKNNDYAESTRSLPVGPRPFTKFVPEWRRTRDLDSGTETPAALSFIKTSNSTLTETNKPFAPMPMPTPKHPARMQPSSNEAMVTVDNLVAELELNIDDSDIQKPSFPTTDDMDLNMNPRPKPQRFQSPATSHQISVFVSQPNERGMPVKKQRAPVFQSPPAILSAPSPPKNIYESFDEAQQLLNSMTADEPTKNSRLLFPAESNSTSGGRSPFQIINDEKLTGSKVLNVRDLFERGSESDASVDIKPTNHHRTMFEPISETQRAPLQHQFPSKLPETFAQPSIKLHRPIALQSSFEMTNQQKGAALKADSHDYFEIDFSHKSNSQKGSLSNPASSFSPITNEGSMPTLPSAPVPTKNKGFRALQDVEVVAKKDKRPFQSLSTIPQGEDDDYDNLPILQPSRPSRPLDVPLAVTTSELSLPSYSVPLRSPGIMKINDTVLGVDSKPSKFQGFKGLFSRKKPAGSPQKHKDSSLLSLDQFQQPEMTHGQMHRTNSLGSPHRISNYSDGSDMSLATPGTDDAHVIQRNHVINSNRGSKKLFSSWNPPWKK